MIDEEWVQVALARVHAKNDALKLWNWKVASRLETGELGPAEASAMKIFGTEFQIEALRILMEILGQPSLIARGGPGALLLGELEHAYRAAPVRTFGGGVNEVQRDIVAQVALGMPRSPR